MTNNNEIVPELTSGYVRNSWKALSAFLRPTLLVHSALDEALGTHVTLACETLQHTGSFKFRAAYNLLRSVQAQDIVSASSGNFGQAVALASRMLGKQCTVVMPDQSAQVKIDAVRRNGATIELVDTTRLSRMDRVRQLLAARPGSFYAPAYDHPSVVAGNSTLGQEIFTKLADVDAVVVPVGGGGLISGIVTARDVLGHRATIFGAEPSLANDAARSFRAGELIANDVEPPTIADGARTLSLGAVTWPIVRAGVEDIIEVPEDAIAEGVRLLFRFANMKAEPTGALSTAAALIQPKHFRGKHVCCVVSGGNVDDALYAAILRREI